jgi:hypothetical protein
MSADDAHQMFAEMAAVAHPPGERDA